MNLIGWIFDNFYIVAAILFGLFSLLGRATKSTQQPTRPAQPSPSHADPNDPQTGRGYGEDRRYDPDEDDGYDPSWDDDDDEDDYDEYERENDQKRRQLNERTDTGSTQRDTLSMGRHNGEASTLDERLRRMEEERARLNERLNRISSTNLFEPAEELSESASSGSKFRRMSADDVRQGIIWSEILSPPKSKRRSTRYRRNML
ncbi:hypothetical protein [Paenibacillus massiliensis]|uniref:hypothetical protein n=1 Tax=Paenibacillus massiliensis TaxID=225917 RepID=UPI000409A39F|nr:hypothetical protein [Paenibacillus massiliensis]